MTLDKAQIGIPLIYQDADFDTALKWIEKVSQKSLGRLRSFVEKQHNGLYFGGVNGCGKTYTGCAIMNLFLKKRILPFRVSQFDLVNSFKENNWKLPGNVIQPYLVFVDEIGKETDITTGTAVLELLLKYRCENGKQTILASNLDIGRVGQLYGNTVLSMIHGYFSPVFFPEIDRRIPGWEKRAATLT